MSNKFFKKWAKSGDLEKKLEKVATDPDAFGRYHERDNKSKPALKTKERGDYAKDQGLRVWRPSESTIDKAVESDMGKVHNFYEDRDYYDEVREHEYLNDHGQPDYYNDIEEPGYHDFIRDVENILERARVSLPEFYITHDDQVDRSNVAGIPFTVSRWPVSTNSVGPFKDITEVENHYSGGESNIKGPYFQGETDFSNIASKKVAHPVWNISSDGDDVVASRKVTSDFDLVRSNETDAKVDDAHTHDLVAPQSGQYMIVYFSGKEVSARLLSQTDDMYIVEYNNKQLEVPKFLAKAAVVKTAAGECRSCGRPEQCPKCGTQLSPPQPQQPAQPPKNIFEDPRYNPDLHPEDLAPGKGPQEKI